jgi:hypothetical protein
MENLIAFYLLDPLPTGDGLARNNLSHYRDSIMA